MKLVKHILQYISRTIGFGLIFDIGASLPNDVVGYTNSDFAKSKPDRQSTGEYVFMLAERAISYFSKL